MVWWVSFMILCAVVPPNLVAHGHGTGIEVLPPVPFNDRLVTVVVDSEKTESEVLVSISFIQDDNRDPIGDTTLYIDARRGQNQLFTQEFWAGDGVVKLRFVSDDSGDGILYENSSGGFLGLLSDVTYTMSGPGLGDGGLYSLDISILSSQGYVPPEPLLFNSAVSVPMTFLYTINDQYWGAQTMQFITYYDVLYNMEYDATGRTISFEMPFEWHEDIINQIDVVHVEFAVPETFGDLLVSDFDIKINGLDLSPTTITIDDYFLEYRTVHLVLPRGELFRLYEQTGDTDIMRVTARPSLDSVYSSVTTNGQYRILVDLEPPIPVSGQSNTVSFNITYVFPSSLAVSVPYDVRIVYDSDMVLYSGSGVSDENNPSSIVFDVPPDIQGPALLQFSNVDDNDLAAATLPIMFNTASNGSTNLIPDWIRNTVGWWAQGTIDDVSFVRAMAFLIENDVIQVDTTSSYTDYDNSDIEPWVRSTAQWWVDGLLSDDEFLASVAFLVEEGVIPVELG
ncbi:MAG: hypothetical protein F4W68_04590 [Cenarchaeum sp. SB0661_bin_35]|nr:hypothetical protein [Cenarchaeum sp. SB0661_bin_35]